MIEDALETFLASALPTGAAVRPWLSEPGDACPRATYALAGTQFDYHLSGRSQPTISTYRVTVWERSYAKARALSAAIAAAADAYVKNSVAGLLSVRMGDLADVIEIDPESLESSDYGRSMDLVLRHNE